MGESIVRDFPKTDVFAFHHGAVMRTSRYVWAGELENDVEQLSVLNRPPSLIEKVMLAKLLSIQVPLFGFMPFAGVDPLTMPEFTPMGNRYSRSGKKTIVKQNPFEDFEGPITTFMEYFCQSWNQRVGNTPYRSTTVTIFKSGPMGLPSCFCPFRTSKGGAMVCHLLCCTAQHFDVRARLISCVIKLDNLRIDLMGKFESRLALITTRWRDPGPQDLLLEVYSLIRILQISCA